MIPFKLFNSQKFKLLGSGNFSSVYYCTVKCPLSTPTKLTNFKNYTEQGVAVKLLNGGFIIRKMDIVLVKTVYKFSIYTHTMYICIYVYM